MRDRVAGVLRLPRLYVTISFRDDARPVTQGHRVSNTERLHQGNREMNTNTTWSASMREERAHSLVSAQPTKEQGREHATCLKR